MRNHSRAGVLPNYFRAFVYERKLMHAGIEFARHTYDHFVCEDEDVDDYEKLLEALDARDRKAVLQWYKDFFPRVIEYIPLGWQRGRFVDGVFYAFHEAIMAH